MKTLQEIEKEMKFGDVYTLGEFIEYVRDGLYNDYDGHGYFHDGDKRTEEFIECNVKFLKKFIGKYPYVCWYNK